MSDDVDGDAIDAIVTVLKERRKKRREDGWSRERQAITSGVLSEILEEDAEANPKTREAIKDAMRYRDLPIIGCHAGYYIPVTEEAVEDAIDELNTRIDGIQERKQLLRDNWETWKQGEALLRDGADADDDDLTEDEREFLEANPISKEELLASRRGGEA